MTLDLEFLGAIISMLSAVLAALVYVLGFQLRRKADKREVRTLEEAVKRVAEAAEQRERAQTRLLDTYRKDTERYMAAQEARDAQLAHRFTTSRKSIQQ